MKRNQKQQGNEIEISREMKLKEGDEIKSNDVGK